jgi:signal transduction histidine kinase
VDELLRMRRLASRLLLLASTDSPGFLHRAPVDVAEFLAETLRRWGQTPRCWSLGALPEASVDADQDRLSAAIDALIENAVRHTSPGDRIELAARLDGENVILAVTDCGAGIPAAEIGRIFGRFTRVDAGRSRQTGGFGLGLAVVKAIAEAHDGSVRVKSTVGHGSTFEILLPTSTARATSKRAPDRQPTPKTAEG